MFTRVEQVQCVSGWEGIMSSLRDIVKYCASGCLDNENKSTVLQIYS